MPPQRAQERPQKVRDVDGFEVMRLKADVQVHVLALRRDGEDSQRRDPIRLVVVRDDGCMPHGRPGPTMGRDKQKAALIQEREMGAKSLCFFLSRAMCSASSAPWPGRRAGSPGVRAPDTSNPSDARASRGARGDSAPQTAPGSPPRYAVGSTARWR